MAAFEISQEMVALCRHGEIVDINSAGAKMLGGDKQGVVGQDLCRFLAGDYEDVGRQLLCLESIETNPIPVELRIDAALKRKVELLVHPAREIGDGFTVVTAKDISKQDNLARSAKRREDRFRLLVEHSMHMVCQCREDRIDYINPAGIKMLGASKKCMPIGWPVWELFADDYKDIVRHGLDDILNEGTVLPMRMMRCDGEAIDVQVLMLRTPSWDGGLEYMIEARDISAHNRAVAALRALNESLENRVQQRTQELANANLFLENLLEAIPTPVWWKDSSDCFMGYNRAFQKFFGVDMGSWLGEPMGKVLPAPAFSEPRQIFLPFQQSQPQIEFEAELSIGERLHNVIVNEKGWQGHSEQFSGTIGVLLDITQRKTMEEELRRLATTDPLTGCNNRRHFLEISATELERARRYFHPLSVMMIDIDFFKKVNDTYGHAAGDDVIRAMVRICQSMLRKEDALGRLGGEEFALLLPETGLDGAQTLAERLRNAIETTAVESGEATVKFTASIGVAELRPSDHSIEAVLSRADDGLYEAKRSGRNRVCRVDA